MRRWNGWGDENTTYHFPASAASYLQDHIGETQLISDSSLEDVLGSVPASRLSEHSLFTIKALDRLKHARGQSLPDWVALRSGRIETYPDAVAYPKNNTEIRTLISYAQQNDIKIIPYGGGTSVVGHINPLPDCPPAITIDLSSINRLVDLDESSRLATFGAGICGPDLEKQLNQRGYTLGHFPQSFELSTLGGWIVTRSSGQQSYYYGRIEDLLSGAHLETPQGDLVLPNFPASAAGPDLRQVVLGSEGRLGIVTQATVRVRPLPEKEAFYGIFFHSWQDGMQAVRKIAQERIQISMARLSDAQETETTLKLSGKDQLVALAEHGLKLFRYGPDRCLLIIGVTGSAPQARLAYRQVSEIARTHGGLFTGETIGKNWKKSRFLTPYLRNSLWERGYAIDTLETAMPWKQIPAAAPAIKAAIAEALAGFDQRSLILAHLSHVYRDGASIYTTFIFRRNPNPETTLTFWRAMKHAASQAILTHGGTISHQHGIGTDHKAYLPNEKGRLGIELIRQAAASLDPGQLMNPGKLFD